MISRHELEDLIGKISDDQWQENLKILSKIDDDMWEEDHPLDD